MPSILPHLAHTPRVYMHFEALLIKLATSPKEILDEVAGWIRPVLRTEDDDIIELNIKALDAPKRTLWQQ